VTGLLVLAATPIGNVRDASPRLRELLATADVVAAEDTRRLRRLASALEVDIGGAVVSYHEHNEGSRTRDLVERMRSGQTVVLVTDAGMPAVSDPGYRLVAACIAADIPVSTAPGPSAALAALAASGLPVDRFCFEGFLPRKPGQRRERLRSLVGEERTMVFFEAPHRLADVLSDMVDLWDAERPAAVCRELTKTYEEVRRGSVAELAAWASDGVRGEITLVVAGASPLPPALTDDELREQVDQLVVSGLSRKDAISAVAERTGTPRRRVYNASI
jgi:16S rRNA (cytidine1402-2'-O)-methyltransferase